MQKTTPPDTLSEEELKKSVEIKALELTDKLKVKVHGFLFKGDGGENDWVIGYMKEPTRQVKAIAMDQTLLGKGFSVGSQIADACLVKEESDARLISELPANDKFVMGSWSFATDLISVSLDQAKKK